MRKQKIKKYNLFKERFFKNLRKVVKNLEFDFLIAKNFIYMYKIIYRNNDTL